MSSAHASQAAPSADTAPVLRGLLLELDSPGALITAAEQVREAGYTKWDTHTPFPVHGIDAAMGICRARLPWVVFLLGVVGCISGVALQWWTNATGASMFDWVPTFLQGYNFPISGKPDFSLPANIPVIFETTVLLAALGAVVGMFAMNNLPRHNNPLFNSERFKRVTADRFFIAIDAADPKFHETNTGSFLDTLGGSARERIEEFASPSKLPQWIVISGLVVFSLGLLPPLFIAKARLSKSSQPRIHLVQDMDNQPRFKAQQAAPAFADGRAARGDAANTIARGDWPRDAHFDTGKIDDAWATALPPQIDVTNELLVRGQRRFDIFCAPCHGLGGAGDGIVHQRALELDEGGWIQPQVLDGERVRTLADGELFNVIANGANSMAPYGDQIPPRDRWAIVAYIRALQYSQAAPYDELPAADQEPLQQR